MKRFILILSFAAFLGYNALEAAANVQTAIATHNEQLEGF